MADIAASVLAKLRNKAKLLVSVISNATTFCAGRIFEKVIKI